MPKISVIIPVYNVEKYLRQCLDSLVNQTFKDIEVICVDDCSTDGSFKILQEYAQKDSRFIVLKQEVNQGPGVARNRGLDVATGDYIMFLDPDDWYELDACESAYNQIEANQNDFVLFAMNYYYQKSGELKFKNHALKPYFENIDNPKIKLEDLEHNFIVNYFSVSYIFRLKFLKDFNIRYTNTYNYEDHWFLTNVFINAKTMSVLNRALYNYRIRNNSLSRSNTKKSIELSIVKNRIIALLETKSVNERVKKYIYAHTIQNSISWLNEEKNNPKLMYNNIKDTFLSMDTDYIEKNIKTILHKKDYKQYQQIIKQNFYTYSFVNKILKSLIQNIFSLKNEICNDIKYKVITILGFRLKIKLKRKMQIVHK